MNIGDRLWHPMSIDIIEHKVIAIHQYETFLQVTTQSVHSVGACGKITCRLDVRDNHITFVDLEDEDERDGLGDFVEGQYYTTFNEARRKFYETQLWIARGNVSDKERLLKEAKSRLTQVEAILKQINQGDESCSN